MLGDPAETGRVDVRIRVVKYRFVQHIYSVGADGERRFFSEPRPLLQRQVEAEPGRSFKAGQRQSEISGCPRLRVLKDDISRVVDNHLVAEAAGDRRIPTKVRRRCPLSGKTLKVFNEPISLSNLSETVRQLADEIRSIHT